MPRAWEGRAAFGKSCQLVDEYVRRGAWALPPPTPGCDASRHWPPMQKEPVFGKIWHYVKTGSYALPAADAPPVTAALRARLATALGPVPADGAADGGEALIAELVDWCVAAKDVNHRSRRSTQSNRNSDFDLPKRDVLYARLPPLAANLLRQERNRGFRHRLETWASFVVWVVAKGTLPKKANGKAGRYMHNIKSRGIRTVSLCPRFHSLLDILVPLPILKAKLTQILTAADDRHAVRTERQNFDDWAKCHSP